MLGHIYSSVERLYVPRLIHLDVKAPVGTKFASSKHYELYRLNWDTVDEFKRNNYIKWAEARWQEPFPKGLFATNIASRCPATLPERYDEIVKSLVFTIPADYMAEIQHFGQIYFMERQRVRKFDTTIRDVCAEVSQAAINCAFKLLADCIYDAENMTWFRENPEADKFVLRCLLMYKFWRENTGHGLVWGLAEMDKLKEAALLMNDVMRTPCTDESRATAQKYNRCLCEIRRWEKDQEKFKNFINGKKGDLPPAEPVMNNKVYESPLMGQVGCPPTLPPESETTRQNAATMLDPYYLPQLGTQQVIGEDAGFAKNRSVIITTIKRPAFLPGTVNVNVGVEETNKGGSCRTPVFNACFDVDGKIGQISTTPSIEVDREKSWLTEEGQLRVVLKRGQFPKEATARVDYEYESTPTH
jgi:hypothetical protein